MRNQNNTSTLCLYHSDADGQGAAAIVRHKLGPDVLLHPINYGDPVPWPLIHHAEQVIIVDFSLPKEDMKRIAQVKDLIWIDHHQSAIQEHGQLAKAWDGLRDTSQAGCVLTWTYFYPDQQVPRGIQLIGDRDIWRWSLEETGPFNEGLYHRDSKPENDQLWKPLLEDDQEILQEIIQEGRILYQARLEKINRTVEAYGYDVNFEGHHTLAINHRGNGDLGARIRELGYEVGYCYVDLIADGRLVTKVTLYSDQLDVSVIAQKFGGGGHPGAAGFQFPRGEKPFPPQSSVTFAVNKKNPPQENS